MRGIDVKDTNFIEKQNENKSFYQDGEKYFLNISGKKISFSFNNIYKFKKLLKLTKKILEIYKNNNEDKNFYIDKDKYGNRIYTDLNLNNGIIDIFNTKYLTNKNILKIIGEKNIVNYVKLLNFIKDKKGNIDILTNIEKELENQYLNSIKIINNKFSYTLEKELNNKSIKELYYDFRDYIIYSDKELKNNILKKYYDTIKSNTLDKDILFSAIFMKILLKKGYKIKYIKGFSIKDINEEEFKYLKNMLPENIKVTFYFKDKNNTYGINYNSLEDYKKNMLLNMDTNIDNDNNIKHIKFSNIKFIKKGNEIKIIGITKKKKIDIGKIQLTDFFSKLLD